MTEPIYTVTVGKFGRFDWRWRITYGYGTWEARQWAGEAMTERGARHAAMARIRRHKRMSREAITSESWTVGGAEDGAGD